MKQQGFSLLEALVSVAVVGVLAAIAVPVYHTKIAKTQASEAVAMMEAEKANISVNLSKKNKCSPDGKSYSTVGKYGTLLVSGDTKIESLKNNTLLLDTGCKLSYTFGSSGVSKRLQGKVINATLMNNAVLSKQSSTSVSIEYLPRPFTEIAPDTYTAPTPLTGGTLVVAKDTESIPEEPPVSEMTGNLEEVRLDGTKCQTQYKYMNDEVVVLLGSTGYYKQEPTYNVRDSINLYEQFITTTGRAPTAVDKVKFITTCATAFVSRVHSIPSITVGDWPSGVSLNLLNYGFISGRGGDGTHVISVSGWLVKYLPNTYKAPGDGIVNSGSVTLNVQNFGVLSGGGSAGTDDIHGGKGGSCRAGGGAPYGLGGITYLEDMSILADNRYGVHRGADATMTTGGSGGRYHDVWSGAGGGLGQSGSRSGNDSKLNPPGYAYKGKVVVVNHSGGSVHGLK